MRVGARVSIAQPDDLVRSRRYRDRDLGVLIMGGQVAQVATAIKCKDKRSSLGAIYLGRSQGGQAPEELMKRLPGGGGNLQEPIFG